MSRGTRRSAAPAVEPDEERDPSSPAQQPAASITELRQDFERFTFLQSIIGKSFMPESEAKDMYRQLTDSEHDDGYQDFVADINEPLTFLFLKLKRTLYHLDNEWYIALVNEIEAIATNDNSDDGKPWVRSVDAVNINLTQQPSYTQTTLTGVPASQPESSSQAANTRLSHAEKEETLKQLVTEGWLAKTPDRAGCYSIGVRTFLELGQYLTELDLPESTRNIWQKFL